ncbi:growth/differentiation factor 10b isoform X2 [Leuresthes tenuis]|uniref:growth/differentiation factor 10b isoform X2 n=1 Tax=Leuresthes tenuis TaxID=355514 RepID=UPI003B511D67
MDFSTLRPLFLIFLWLKLLSANVAPPTKVTLDCHNLRNILSWGYDELSPGLRFKVAIGSDVSPKGCPNELWVDQPDLQADVSFLSDPSASYRLTVTAFVGQNESHSVPSDGIMFSYFKNSLVSQKCSLDLPPVDVIAQTQNEVLFRFDHPWLVYYQNRSQCTKQKKKKRHENWNRVKLPDFKYNVIVGKKEFDFICEERVCEETLGVDPTEEKHCLNISGEMDKISIEPKEDYCVQSLKPQSLNHTYIYIGVTILALMAGAFVLFMVFHKKTRPPTALPKFMENKYSAGQESTQQTKDSFSRVEVEIDSTKSLLTTPVSETGIEFPSGLNGSTENDLRMPLGILSRDESVPQDRKEGSLNGENATYMQGNNLDDDDDEEESASTEVQSSGYETRPVPVHLAPEENAVGYH